MADESEDQWLYGDSTDSKEYTPTNVQSELQQNDSTLVEAQENLQTQEDQKMESVDETPSEVRDLTSLDRLQLIYFSHFNIMEKDTLHLF
jgi:hypothetical protein